jgi:hypothetical protein
MKMRKMSLGIVLTLTTLASVASAVTINVDLQSSGAPTYTGTGGAGGGTWNGVIGTTSASATDLLDSTGAGTSVDFSATGADGTGDIGPSIPESVNALLNDYMFTTGTISFTISDLPNGTYDLYLYGAAGNYTGQRANFTITGVGSQALSGASGGTTDGGTGGTVPGTDLGKSYAKFAGIIVTGGQITGTGTPNGSHVPFNGFQLVSVVPEPSGLVLACLSAVGLFVKVRRCRR